MSSGSFAAAQSRILARQQARLAEVQSRIPNPAPSPDHATSTSPTILSRLTSRLSLFTTSPKSSLTNLTHLILSSDGTHPSLRVGQVDAELLDAELISLLKSQINDGLKYYGAHLQDDWSHEIHLALRAILFKLSIWDNNASYGAALQGLQYTDARSSDYDTTRRVRNPSRWQKSAHGLITVLGKYAWDKWEDYLLDAEGSYDGLSDRLRLLSQITTRLTTVHSLAALTSFCVFLVNGKYRTLTDRLLRLRLVSPTNQTSREVSFEYLNRQLVWHAFTEFLLFLLPLVGISRWRRWISRAWRNAKRSLTASSTDGTEQDPEKVKTGPLAFLPERTCAICYQDQNPSSETDTLTAGANIGAGGGGVLGSATTDITNPYETVPCACIYCFVCLATRIEAEEGSGWPCLRCGEVVYRCRPWGGDVIVEKRRDENKKTVGFATDDHEHDRDAAGAGPGPALLRTASGEVLQEEETNLGASEWQIEGA